MATLFLSLAISLAQESSIEKKITNILEFGILIISSKKQIKFSLKSASDIAMWWNDAILTKNGNFYDSDANMALNNDYERKFIENGGQRREGFAKEICAYFGKKWS